MFSVQLQRILNCCLCSNSRYTVVLNGRETIREGFIKQSFADRPEHSGTCAVYINTHAKGKLLYGVFTSWELNTFISVDNWQYKKLRERGQNSASVIVFRLMHTASFARSRVYSHSR